MTVGFVTEHDLSNPSLRSGVPYHIAQAMNALDIEVMEIRIYDRRPPMARLISRINQFYFSHFHHTQYDASVSIAAGKSFAKQATNARIDATDFIFTISCKLVALLETSKPIFLWLDNSFLSFALYPGMHNLSSLTHKEALDLEKRAFENCAHLFVASTWLKESLCKQYDFLHSKISVLPRGANILQRPKKSIIEGQINCKINQPLHLLHINSGWWERKGGDFTITVWEKLRKSMQVDLTIIGSVPNDKKAYLEGKGVVLLGSVDKSDENGFSFFANLMSSAHFLLVPSIADGFGIVYAEAASFGVPSVAFGVMGVTEAVQQNVTGIHLPIDAGVEDFVQAILKVWQDKSNYKKISVTAYDYAAENFEWLENVRTLVEMGAESEK